MQRNRKKATLKDLREINRILKKVDLKENKVHFGRVAEKGNLFVIGVSDASYNQKDQSVAVEILMIGNKEEKMVLLIFWKSGVIRKVNKGYRICCFASYCF